MLTTDTATKVCAICRTPKPLEASAKRTRSADGRQRHCKACCRAALDAADARRKARTHPRRPIAIDFDELEALFASRAFDVMMALWDAAEAGAEDPLEDLAAALEPVCPADAEGFAGPECYVHTLAQTYWLVRTGDWEPAPLPPR
jgi:hypothetical protein